MDDELKKLKEAHARQVAEHKRLSHCYASLMRENADIKRQNKIINTQNVELDKRLKKLVADLDDLKNHRINTQERLRSLDTRLGDLFDRFSKLADKLREKFHL